MRIPWIACPRSDSVRQSPPGGRPLVMPCKRPRRPLGAAEQHARLDLDRALPGGELLLAHLGSAAADRRRNCHEHPRRAPASPIRAALLIGVRRHHLEQEEDAAIGAEIRLRGVDDGVVEQGDLAGIEREDRRPPASIDRRVDILLAREQAVGRERLLVRQQRTAMRAGNAADAAVLGRAGDSASATMTTIGLTSA